MRSIYVILSQTGNLMSKTLKLFTHDEYNHVSISLDPNLETMYSFGRLNPYNPFHGGFVVEGKEVGTFKRFQKTKAMVLELQIDDEKYNKLKNFISIFIQQKEKFKYNYLGVLLAYFHKDYAPKWKYYCSQFVRKCLEDSEIDNINEIPKIAKPIDFLTLTNKKIIYIGRLRDYNAITV